MFSSLKAKIILLCVTICVAAMLTVAGSNFFTTRQHSNAQLEQQAALLLKTQAKAIAEWVAAKQGAVASLKQSSGDKDALAAVKAAEKAGLFDMVFMAWPDKRAVFSQERQRAADYDPTARAWYKGARQANGPFISMPYIGASSGKLLITFADQITDSQGPVAGADVLLGTVVDSVLDIRPTPNSYAFLLASDGTVIAHPDKELTLKPLNQIHPTLDASALRSLAQAGTALHSSFQGKDARLFLQTVGNTGWMLALVLDEAEATANLRSILWWSALSVLLISVLAALVMFALVTRMLSRVQELRDAIGAAGEGNFSQRLVASGNDELTEITEAFNRFAERITSTLHGIRDSSESVRSSSNEIASGNLDLSYRTEKQAASLAETASSVAKLTEAVMLNADSAIQANQLAGNASGVAKRGGDAVAKVVDMMGTMNESSKRIFDIISVIDQIAFQTNILALNAAVEAARAGEQGRGFAVVAAEVRSLAQRSATAAREIQTLITDSVARVESGSALVGDAGRTMEEIVESVAQVTSIMGEITRASQSQAEDLAHINQAITGMDGSTQQNAALVEQAAAAAGSLHEEASKLAKAVAVFQLR